MKVVMVVELDPENVERAINNFQRFATSSGSEDYFGLHICVDDYADKVLALFEREPTEPISEADVDKFIAQLVKDRDTNYWGGHRSEELNIVDGWLHSLKDWISNARGS